MTVAEALQRVRVEWREEGQNGAGLDGELIRGRYFCVFGDGTWYSAQHSTPWRVYLGVMKRLIKAARS